MRDRVLDLTGVQFGNLTVEGPAERPEGRRDHRSYWVCRCGKCGGSEVIPGEDLNANRRKRCRACTEAINNLVGREFGTWKVERKAEPDEIPNQQSAGKMSWWRVKCVLCGAEAIRSRPVLRKLRQQCQCIEAPKPQPKPQPFVPRTADDSTPIVNLHVKKAKCAYGPCGKIFELETGGQWGWNIGRDLFCTYKHMRAEEKERAMKPRRGARKA